MITENLMLQAV